MKKRIKKYNHRSAKIKRLANGMHVAIDNMFIVKSSKSKLEVRGLEKLSICVNKDDMYFVLKGLFEELLTHERKWNVSIAVWTKVDVHYVIDIIDLKLDEHTANDFNENLNVILIDHVNTENMCGYLLVAAPNNRYDLYDTVDRNIDIFGGEIVEHYEKHGFKFDNNPIDVCKLIDQINYPDPNNYTIANSIK